MLVIITGEGVDLILDCVGASHWEQNTDALKAEGRWVLYGSMGQ
jgi:tumor protein p53-inducible protein 3